MRLESYAQEFEDLFLFSMLSTVDKGFYIDVGANDPTADSVTKFFYDRGWHGINIEPLKNRCRYLEEMRPRDINLCIGLGAEHGRSILYDLDTLATFKKDIAKNSLELIEIPRDVETFKSPEPTEIFTLTEIFNEYCSKNQPIHFCKIDVEGFEKEVLLGVKNWHEFRPWLFCIESTVPMTETPCFEEWEYILLENGYQFAFQYKINRYYVDSRKKYLAKTLEEVVKFLSLHELRKASISLPMHFE